MPVASVRETANVRGLSDIRQAAAVRTNDIARDQLESILVPDPVAQSQADAELIFADLHTESEPYYDGNGGWESLVEMGHTGYTDADTPSFRGTTRRVFSYLRVYQVAGTAIYRTRAQEGLTFLLANQSVDGRFDTQGTAGEVLRGRSDRGDAYPTGLSGRALLQGYTEFGNAAYLTASEDAGDWEISGTIHQDATNPLESLASFKNANHVGFIIWHLAAHHKISANATFLERMVWGAQKLIEWQIKDGTKSDGTWYWYEGSGEKRMPYHSIALRGLLEVYSALEANSANATDKVEIGMAIHRALDYLIRWQINVGLYPGFLPWSEALSTSLWCSDPGVLCLAYDYFDAVIRDQIELFIFELVKVHKARYDLGGTLPGWWSWVVSGDTRQHLILNFAEYLRAFYS